MWNVVGSLVPVLAVATYYFGPSALLVVAAATIGAVGTERLFGAPVAHRLGAGFVPARKPGKLPAHTIGEEYELEYGTDTLEIHSDAIETGERGLIVDDLIAIGGTITFLVAVNSS